MKSIFLLITIITYIDIVFNDMKIIFGIYEFISDVVDWIRKKLGS